MQRISTINSQAESRSKQGGEFGSIIHASHTRPMITPTISPFAQEARIRPRYPWHLWRQYPVIVENCYLASTIWLVKVRVLAETEFSETVLASDFERVIE